MPNKVSVGMHWHRRIPKCPVSPHFIERALFDCFVYETSTLAALLPSAVASVAVMYVTVVCVMSQSCVVVCLTDHDS